MWQRFSKEGRDAIFLAQDEAKSHGQDFVSTEYLVLAICRQTETLAAKTLERCGTSPAEVRQLVLGALPSSEGEPGVKMSLTHSAKRTIDFAFRAAAHLKDRYIGPEHLLLGLLRDSDTAACRTLFKAGLSYEKALAAYLSIRDHA